MTDTSRSDDLVERLRSVDVSWSETGEWCAEAADRIEALEAEITALSDPVVVHVNMLRGGIAKPSLAQIIHIYGEEAIRAALGEG